MPDIDTIVCKLGCFGMFSCYDKDCEACQKCKVQRECQKLADENYSKMENIIEAELD